MRQHLRYSARPAGPKMCRGKSDVSSPISREALMMHIIPACHACAFKACMKKSAAQFLLTRE